MRPVLPTSIRKPSDFKKVFCKKCTLSECTACGLPQLDAFDCPNHCTCTCHSKAETQRDKETHDTICDCGDFPNCGIDENTKATPTYQKNETYNSLDC